MSTVDSFPSPKRTFYERTRTKLVASLILGGITCFLLGFASAAGGQSMSAGHLKEQDLTSEVEDSLGALQSGFGFACFCYILAFIMVCAASIYYSPLFCGSAKEKSMINNPYGVEVDGDNNGFDSHA